MSSFQICQRLAVTNGTDAYTQPFPMDGNAFRIGVFIYNLTATSLTATPQGSCDNQNWHDLTAASSLGLGHNTFSQGSITDAMVRLKLTVVGTGVIILGADAWTSQQ